MNLQIENMVQDLHNAFHGIDKNAIMGNSDTKRVMFKRTTSAVFADKPWVVTHYMYDESQNKFCFFWSHYDMDKISAFNDLMGDK